MMTVRATPEISLAAKVEFLQQPESFPDRPDSIEVIETHFAWVFLCDQFAYKLKKPILFQDIDFTSLENRKVNCDLELKLNRRLGEKVYISVVPLSHVEHGLRLESDGEVVEWLVKMHRLPHDRMLDQAAMNGHVATAELEALVAKLASFYRRTSKAPWHGTDYTRHLTQQIQRCGGQLSALAARTDLVFCDRLVATQLDFIGRNAALLEARLHEGRVVDAHGDLKPEHIFLDKNPQIIDCLEFSSRLRLLDTAEEISFLDLECERLGQADIGKRIWALYREHCADSIDRELFEFYRSQRALIRALLSAWHLEDHVPAQTASHWLNLAHWYLRTAQVSLDQATG